MGWGIVYPPYSVINMGAVQPPTPTTRWVYNFNGVDSYIDLGSINYTAGDTISLKASKPSNGATFPTVVGNTANSFLLRHTSSGKIELRGATGTVNGVDIVSNATDWPIGDSEFNLTLTVGGLVRYLCSRSDAVTGLFQGRVYDYQDSLGNNYPINDRTFGAGAVIANTGTGPNATGINLLESGWTEIPL